MRTTKAHLLIASSTLLLTINACTKSSLVSPDIATNQTPQVATERAATPVGTVVYTSNGYTLTFTNKDAGFDDAIRQRFVDIFFQVYPQLLSRFNTGASKSVTFIVDPAYTGVAATSGGRITYNPGWFRSNPQDVDVVTHEIMHVVQAYPGGAPGWLTEGIADFVRYKYGVNNAAAGWSLPAYSSSQHYTNSYRITARFLAWLELRVSNTIVNQLNTALRNQTYTANTWNQLTGKSVDQLWADYGRNPAL
ncbi:basic secretory family protein [Chitinophaga pendula]|uniref:basic secretory protein-like protein n=1 Tax=Chitinophaga TaxID=79328 RepID=UPI000BAEE62D|nr:MULTISPECIES: basic secretory protein-like protein [Chitinophaga]ASZ12301.1 secretory protein [Chitinophaga sp. MD30]UCJ10110.1 basic secretory family protein [Chitinophaga pendula]